MTYRDPVDLSTRCAHVYHLYGRANDAHDIDQLRALATDDVTITITGLVQKHAVGIEAYLDLFRAHDPGERTRHVITSVVAEADGDRIRSRADFRATVFGEPQNRVTYGVYRDVFRQDADGRLLVAHKYIAVQRVLHLPATGRGDDQPTPWSDQPPSTLNSPPVT
jgi:ketosteroid isomerase-like protein